MQVGENVALVNFTYPVKELFFKVSEGILFWIGGN